MQNADLFSFVRALCASSQVTVACRLGQRTQSEAVSPPAQGGQHWKRTHRVKSLND